MDQIAERLKAGTKTRIVGFGSSNTERSSHSLGRFIWLDWLDCGLRNAFGRVHYTINTGFSGDTTRGLLERFDEDVALYQPHVVLVTIGGNDSNPAQEMSRDEFRGNLLEVVRRIDALPDARAVLQTYYSFDMEFVEADHGAKFLDFMQIVREVAADTGTPLVDHLARALGNMVMGLDLMRPFKGCLDDPLREACTEGLRYQATLDELQAG